MATDSALIVLAVTGFRDAVVSVPTAATEPRPVVVALHGNYDRPEWQCEVMRDVTGGYPFVLCPRGIPRRDAPRSADRWEYAGLEQTRRELDAGLASLRARFSAYVSKGPLVLTGFSLGAILARSLARDEPASYPRLVLTEGGAEGWQFERFRERGGLRLLLGCAQAGCATRARGIARRATRANVEVRVADGGNVGHTYDGPVAAAIKAEWRWLVDGDSQWSGFTAGPSWTTGAESKGSPSAAAAH